MKVLWLCILLMVVGSSIGDLPPPERSYKILMLLPASSKSHRNVFIPVAEALADRGHKIVMLTSHDKPSKHPNIHEISHGLKGISTDEMNMFDQRTNPTAGLSMFLDILPEMARDLYKVPQVKKIYDKRKEFDLIIINHMFNEIAYPFVQGMPFITIATCGYDPRHSAVLGNPPNPSYIPNLIGGADLSSIFGRFKNAMFHVAIPFYWRNWAIVPAIEKEFKSQFPGLPSLMEIDRNQSLALLNSHFSMDIPIVPLLPTQVEIGGMHCKPGQPLPEKFQDWIEGAGSAGVVYFSLGSVARGDTMPVIYRNMFLEAFRKMEQRVLWKFEGDLENVPKNVMISNWLPQQDILAHPNVKVFITHGGLLSNQESSYHATPMLVLPIFGDQAKIGDKVVNGELGLALVWEQLTVDIILESLMEIINNTKYAKNVAEVSRLFQDQIDTPKERAVFWTEFVIRNNGASRLRTPALELSWVAYLMLDVYAILLLFIVLVGLTLRWILRKIICKIFGTKNKKKKRD